MIDINSFEERIQNDKNINRALTEQRKNVRVDRNRKVSNKMNEFEWQL